MFSYCDVVHKDNCFRITYAEYTDVGESSYAKICTICIVNVQSEWGLTTYENDLNEFQLTQMRIMRSQRENAMW